MPAQESENKEPRYLDHDQRFQQIIEEKVTAWNREHPTDPLPIDALITRDDGARVIKEEVVAKLPGIDEEARNEFADNYKEEFNRYETNEKSRIYKDSDGNPLPENDPAYKKIMRETKERIEKARFGYEKLQTEQKLTGQQIGQIGQTTESPPPSSPQQQSSFADEEKKLLNENLKGFIKDNPLKAEEYAKKDPLLQQALREYKEEQAKEHAQKDVARQVAEGLRQSGVPAVEELSEEEYEQITPEKVELIAFPPSQAEDVISEYNEPRQRWVGGSSSNPVSAFNNARRVARMGRAGLRGAGQLASKTGALAAKAAPLVTNPWFWIVMGIVTLIILIIIVLAGAFSSREETQENIPVTITKSGPADVANGQNITYAINVSYLGRATDIIITDSVPQGAEFVEASGVFSCEPAPCGPASRTITWKASEQRGGPISGTPAPSPTPSGTGFNFAVYQAEGFPPPSEPNPVSLDSSALQIYKSSVVNHIVKASQIVGIDPGITAMWSFFEGINYNNSFSNCSDTGDRFDPNVPCMTNNWQVGHGIRPGETYEYLQEAFDTMYGNHDNATVQRVGQSVIQTVASRHPENAITYPSTTFPNVSLSQLTSNMGDPQMRTWVGHLMRDDAIYAYLISKVFKGHWDGPGQLAETMECCWGSATHYSRQRVINYVKAIYDAGLSGGGTSFPAMIFDLTVKPIDDTYIINQASAQVIP